MDASERARLRALAAKASSHPWVYFRDHNHHSIGPPMGGPPGPVRPVCYLPTGDNQSSNDGRWIEAAQPAAVVALLDALAAAEKRAEEAESALRAEFVDFGEGRIVVEEDDEP